MNVVTKSVEIGGNTIHFETGKLAKQAKKHEARQLFFGAPTMAWYSQTKRNNAKRTEFITAAHN